MLDSDKCRKTTANLRAEEGHENDHISGATLGGMAFAGHLRNMMLRQTCHIHDLDSLPKGSGHVCVDVFFKLFSPVLGWFSASTRATADVSRLDQGHAPLPGALERLAAARHHDLRRFDGHGVGRHGAAALRGDGHDEFEAQRRGALKPS